MKKQITSSIVEGLVDQIKKSQNLKKVSQFVKILRISLKEGKEREDDYNKNTQEQDFIIEQGEVFEQILKFAITELPQILMSILKIKEGQELTKFPNTKIEIIVKVFLISVYKFIKNLTEDDIILFIYKCLPTFITLATAFPIIEKKFLGLAIEQWATSDKIPIKLNAFISIRMIAQNHKSEKIEKIFRKMFAAYALYTKIVTWRNYDLILFMNNCFVELLKINLDAAYYITFSYIRQLGILVKSAMTHKEKDSDIKLFNWEILNSIQLWSQAVQTYNSHDQLGQLIYPLIEVISGFMTLNKATEYLPFRLHLIDILLKLSEKSQYFVPILNYLQQFLAISEFYKKKKISTKKPYDLILHLKISKQYESTNVLWNGLFDKIINQIICTLSLNSRDIGFPESSYATLIFLKHQNKLFKFNGYKIKIKELIKLIEKNNEIIFQKRKNTQIAPKNQKNMLDFITSYMKDIKLTPLEEKNNQIQEEIDNYIKERILAEKNAPEENKSEEEEEEEEEQRESDNQEVQSDEGEGEEIEKEEEEGEEEEEEDEDNQISSQEQNDEGQDEEDEIDRENRKIQNFKKNILHEDQKKKNKQNEEKNQEDYDWENMDYSGDPSELEVEKMDEEELKQEYDVGAPFTKKKN